MKIFVEKALDGKKDQITTKTSRFLQLLINKNILPIKMSDDEVVFEFFSRKMLLHVLGVLLILACSGYGFIILPKDFIFVFMKIYDKASWTEKVSFYLGGIGPLIFVTLPGILAHGLKNMDVNVLQNKKLGWPKIGYVNIFGKLEFQL